MSQSAENLRDLLSLARMLRRFAEERTRDNHHALFLATAVALEDRAHILATAAEAPAPVDVKRDYALHVPINCLV
jgi:hypothetical protein